MSTSKSQLIREYQRASKSPWDDNSTILLLADVDEASTNDSIELSFSHYIYMHRDRVGSVLGISISKQLFDDNPDFSGRYLDGVEMYAFLLLYIEQIKEFCHLFSAEFEAIFLTKPRTFFSYAEESWLEIIEKS
ncbi:hypothetical protein AN394_04202 [Pseudoalteromonas sp. P1-26]|uniref:hypothetical protein n=1 Tax=Pseudoalteromonas sp. P1-26 TaxID=1723759 RepID=UPI0006D657B8|nr:hypothetical protein [Pseudoalteromonas sp. P1-26]KPZ65739.1 hypothetical protein AN394_04202 [Pseudoalteromonas sp. P1-26]